MSSTFTFKITVNYTELRYITSRVCGQGDRFRDLLTRRTLFFQVLILKSVEG